MEDFKRLFVAIPVPELVCVQLAGMQKKMTHAALRWTPIENLHLTVHFLGKVNVENLDFIKENIKNIGSRCLPFDLVANNLRVIYKKRKPLMIWVEFMKSKNFEKLAVESRVVLPGDISKNVIPHITLARFGKWTKTPVLEPLPELTKFDIPVNSMELWESILSSGHPKYLCIEKYYLGLS